MGPCIQKQDSCCWGQNKKIKNLNSSPPPAFIPEGSDIDFQEKDERAKIQDNMKTCPFSQRYEIPDKVKAVDNTTHTTTLLNLHKCVHKESKQMYTVQVMNKNLVNQDNIKQIQNQCELMKELEHDNICQIKEFIYEKDFYYRVMEMCEGETLMDRIGGAEGVGESEVVDIARQLLKAVTYMHGQNIIHRNLEPNNILVENGKLKIFGFENAERFCSGTIFRRALGSDLYRAPEIIKGEYTEKADIWAVGVILYQLLQGKTPFTGQNQFEIEDSILYDFPDFQQGKIAKIQENGQNLIVNLLSKEPSKRISTKEALDHEWLKIYPEKEKSGLPSEEIDHEKSETPIFTDQKQGQEQNEKQYDKQKFKDIVVSKKQDVEDPQNILQELTDRGPDVESQKDATIKLRF